MFRSNQTADIALPIASNEAWHFFHLHMYAKELYRRQAPHVLPN